jgi:hypothetical protein
MPDAVDETPETDPPNDRDEELAKAMDNDMDLNPYLTPISEPTEDTIVAQSTTDTTSITVLPLEASFLTHLPVENTAKAAATASAGGGVGKGAAATSLDSMAVKMSFATALMSHLKAVATEDPKKPQRG